MDSRPKTPAGAGGLCRRHGRRAAAGHGRQRSEVNEATEVVPRIAPWQRRTAAGPSGRGRPVCRVRVSVATGWSYQPLWRAFGGSSRTGVRDVPSEAGLRRPGIGCAPQQERRRVDGSEFTDRGYAKLPQVGAPRTQTVEATTAGGLAHGWARQRGANSAANLAVTLWLRPPCESSSWRERAANHAVACGCGRVELQATDAGLVPGRVPAGAGRDVLL